MFGNIIKEQLRYLNLSQKELAIKTSLSEQLISEVISEKREPTIDVTLKLEEVFKFRKFLLYEYFINEKKLKNQKKDKELNKLIPFFEKQKKYTLMATLSIYGEIAKILGTTTLIEKKKEINQIVEGFYKYKDKPLAYLWISILENKYAHLRSKGKFKKSLGQTVIKGALDILIKNIKIEKRLKTLKTFLDKHGIILINAPFIPDSTINGTCFKRNTQRFIFMSDKQKREYSYIFTLIHELLHYYENFEKEDEKAINLRASEIILSYLVKYNKKHVDLELAIQTFKSKNKSEKKWSKLREQTTKRINFGEVSNLFD